jgi:hypothetical protein
MGRTHALTGAQCHWEATLLRRDYQLVRVLIRIAMTTRDQGWTTRLDHCPDIDDDLIHKTARDDQVGTSIEAFEAIMDATTEMIEAPRDAPSPPSKEAS